MLSSGHWDRHIQISAQLLHLLDWLDSGNAGIAADFDQHSIC